MGTVGTGVMDGVVARSVDATQDHHADVPSGSACVASHRWRWQIEVDTVRASALDGTRQE